VNAVIIVAGGKGSRFGGDVPKQFLEIANTPIYIYTINQFNQFDPSIEIILVVPKSSSTQDLDAYRQDLSSYDLLGVQIVRGGDTRFHSVKNGLLRLTKDIKIVGVHDAVRPLVSQAVIRNSYETAVTHGNAIPSIRLTNSIRKVENDQSTSLNRDNYRLIQTPQCFKKNDLIDSYNVEYNHNFTDDASVYEASGNKIKLVKGNPENIKITTPQDLLYVKFVVEGK